MTYDKAIKEVVLSNGVVKAWKPSIFGTVELIDGYIQFNTFDRSMKLIDAIPEYLTMEQIESDGWKLLIDPETE